MSRTSLGSGPRLHLGLGLLILALGAVLLSGCASSKMSWQTMAAQPKFVSYDENPFFRDQMSNRPQVPNTVARGFIASPTSAYVTGKDAAGNEVSEFPYPVTMAMMERGQERYNIYCTPCHGYTGVGNGVVVQRGYPQPPSFYDPRLINAPVGHFVNAMNAGWARMPTYAFQVNASDRWAIAAYIRALQFSQNVNVQNMSAEQRQQVEAGGSP